jgi:hypothetical protein
VKSRRGAPKRINTEGFACPNRRGSYYRNTEAHVHALVGNGTHGKAERIQTLRCQACHTTFTARRHRLYRTGESDHPSWGAALARRRPASGAAVPTASGQSGMVASLLPFCTPSRSSAGEACAGACARWQIGGATLPAANNGDGSRENQPTMDGSLSARLPLVAGLCLSGTEARCGAVSCRWDMGEGDCSKTRLELCLRKK